MLVCPPHQPSPPRSHGSPSSPADTGHCLSGKELQRVRHPQLSLLPIREQANASVVRTFAALSNHLLGHRRLLVRTDSFADPLDQTQAETQPLNTKSPHPATSGSCPPGRLVFPFHTSPRSRALVRSLTSVLLTSSTSGAIIPRRPSPLSSFPIAMSPTRTQIASQRKGLAWTPKVLSNRRGRRN